MKEIESIHLSTLKGVLKEVIKDSKSNDPDEMADFMVEHFFGGKGLGRYGKIGKGPNGCLEFYSEFACLDFPFEMGRMLFILGE